MFTVNKKLVLILIVFLSGLFVACSEDDDFDDNTLSGALIINEIAAKNLSLLQDEHNDFDDWIELYNASDDDIDIGGYWLSDEDNNPFKWQVPENVPLLTTIQAGEYLIIWADNEPNEGALHTNFSLSGNGEFVGLADERGDEIDQITFGPQNEDVSYGRLPNGSNNWQYLDPPTPGALNSNQATNRPPMIDNVISTPENILPNEKVYVRAEVLDEEYVSSVSLFYRVYEGEFIETEMVHEYGAIYVGEIPGQDPEALVEYYISATDNNNLTSTNPTYAPVSLYSYEVMGFNEDRVLFINEIQSVNNVTITDGSGEYDDWIEIYNSSDAAIDIGGYFLTDDLSNPYLYQIPYNQGELTTIPAGGFLILWADNDIEQGPLHLPFKLSASGESIGLYVSDEDTSVLLDAVNFPELQEDESYGRSEDGGAEWVTFALPTPGTGNGQ